MVRKLNLTPDRASYRLRYGVQTVSAKLEGGLTATRTGIRKGAHRVTVQWTVQGFEYWYLRAFYRRELASGAKPCLMDLLVDQKELTTHIVWFVPQSFSMSSQGAQVFVVTAELEVSPWVEEFFELFDVDGTIIVDIDGARLLEPGVRLLDTV